MKNILISLFFLSIFIFLGLGIYRLIIQNQEFKEQYTELQTQGNGLKSEIEKVNADIEYFSNSSNLEKEAKSQFNYRQPSENLIIIVPATSTGE